MIELRALGTAEIHTDSAILTPSQEIVFAVGLYIVLERGKRVSRAGLASLIWPDSGQRSRGHRLRQTILQLKKLGFQVQADRDSLRLRADDARSDSDNFDDRAAAPLLQEPSLEFLPGYNPGFSTPFRDWIETTRNEFQSAAIAVLVNELGTARLHGNWQSADRIATKCLSLDPFNEEAVLARAEAAAMRGSKRKAVSILDHYIAEIGGTAPDLKLPASVLRRRVVERIPDRATLLNADPAFVGRELEMAVLTRAFEQARAGKGSAVMLVGEPGIGKTRLSAELARFAELRGARVQRTSCRRADVDRPLSFFVDVVPQLREMPGALGCAPETFSWLRRLTEFEQRAEESSRAVDAEMLFENIRAALFDLLESVVEEHCLVIVIEDLQWLDKASANLLVRMAEWSSTKRILFLLNARPGNNTLLEYADRVPVEAIALGPLGAEASTAILKSIALTPGDEPECAFVNWCLGVAEGNPFFLQELAHQWIETGQRYEAPPSVSKVLQERLSRLSSEALQVLQTCAVLSDYATLSRVERVLEYHPHQLLAAVEELSNAAMLGVPPESTEITQDQIQPRHDFLSSAATTRLSPISLAFLHRRVADVLETDLAHETVSATLLWACATHRHHAGDRVRALSLRMSCAEHLLELGLPHDACAAYQKTMDYCVTDDDRLKVLSRLARAFELDGQWTQSIEMLRVCISLAAKTDRSQGVHNDYELQMLDARHRSALDFVTLLDESLNCVNSDQASPRHRVGAAVLAMKLSVDFGRYDYVDAIYSQVSQFLQHAEVSELKSLELQTIYRTERGDGFVPIGDLQHLTEVARQTEGELGYSQALIMAATACRLSARYEEGLRFASQALDHAIKHRLHSRRRQTMISALTLHVSAGAFDKARQGLTEIADFPFSSDSAKESNEMQLLEARVALEEGDFARAESAFRRVEVPSANYSPIRKGYYLAVALQIRLSEGAGHEAIRPLVTELEAAHMRMRHVGARDFESYSLFLGLCALDSKDRALRQLREYVERRRVKWPLSKKILTALNIPSENPQPGPSGSAKTRKHQETAARRTDPLSGVL